MQNNARVSCRQEGRILPVMTSQTFIDKCFKDKNGHWAIVSKPNLPLAVWFVAMLASKLFNGLPGQLASTIAFGALFTWAWLELFSGVNYFRRALGLVILVAVIWNRL